MNRELCKAEIKRHEGEVLAIYEDSLGFKTLGVGHLCKAGEPESTWEIGTPVSQEVVDMYFEEDFDKHYMEAIHVIGGDHVFQNLPEIIQRVVVNMCFNLGGTRLSKFRNMIAACQNHDWEEMARQMQDSKWYYQVGRRSRELQQAVLSLV